MLVEKITFSILVWKDIPPIEVFNFLILIFWHIDLIKETIEVLGNDKEGCEEDEYGASSSVNGLICCVDNEKYHVSEVIETIEILVSSLEQVYQNNDMNVFTQEKAINPEDRFSSDTDSEESNEAILSNLVINSLDVTADHHVEKEQG